MSVSPTTSSRAVELNRETGSAHYVPYVGEDLTRSREAFLNDWVFGMSAIEVNVHTMTALPALMENYPLKAADAIHLSAAIWLRDRFRLLGHQPVPKGEVEFGVADTHLSKAAAKCGLLVFNPELFD